MLAVIYSVIGLACVVGLIVLQVTKPGDRNRGQR